jgi:glyoxylase-like metal-dependent hydrolase (beta-lactamase superfamily II)
LDHLGGLTSGGKKNFPNAVVRVRFEAWPYKASDEFKPFDGETELVAGVHAYPTNGETPGHMGI